MLQLTGKERSLLQELKKHEEVCIQKYNNYANQAQDPQLKNLFQQYAFQEQRHYDTINQLLQGQQPNLTGQGQQKTGIQFQTAVGQQPIGMHYQSAPNQSYAMQGAIAKETDVTLCNDMLMTERFVSGSYDTSIFDAVNPQVRQALQHIQQEEQQHGQGIVNYLNQKGMKSVTP
ncbi:spore coat protein [Calderihabitans maritimus]|nr:spore coat protein [Calderihabitans maritimus]